MTDYITVNEALALGALPKEKVLLRGFYLVVRTASIKQTTGDKDFYADYVSYLIQDKLEDINQFRLVESPNYNANYASMFDYAVYVASNNLLDNFYEHKYAGWLGSHYVIKAPVLLEGALGDTERPGFRVEIKDITSAIVYDYKGAGTIGDGQKNLI